MQNMINWFEIPAVNFDRAVKFYSTILGVEITSHEFMGTQMGFLPSDGENVSGAIVKGDDYTPAKDGLKVYLNGGKDLTKVLDRVEGAGGIILVPKTKISDEMGYFAMFKDSESNMMALHSMN